MALNNDEVRQQAPESKNASRDAGGTGSRRNVLQGLSYASAKELSRKINFEEERHWGRVLGTRSTVDSLDRYI
jgi:hypothetical protein